MLKQRDCTPVWLIVMIFTIIALSGIIANLLAV